MKTQGIIIVHPQTAEQVDVLQAFLQALKIKFEISKADTAYNPEFVEKIQQGRQDYKAGKGKVVTMDELNRLWK